ncbi:TOMM precursor leader peptide-binding protein [Psychromonas sp. Urea-02u-13]|uniref:TOMM precursor leader peptide-binding protein n=1 Tax=Psychromonas sp. Urea-02u-13 TaxID=2058326 RepID=UPI000C31CCD7|nr:TOMM precursor leader peptide-binding protein [Psychromonas sp. Urea-02u-13]PKG39285.1 hypothetical protein CXF74_08980 [Psychromonas sp. Urea-02u-13]
MNIFDQRLDWHRKFTVATVSNLHVKFVSESISSLLEIETYNAVNDFISSGKTLIDYSMGVNPQYAAYLHHCIQSLVDSDYLAPLDVEGESYFHPDFKVAYELKSESDGYSLVMLSQCIEEDRIKALLIATKITEKTNIVIVDDYLDPRIKEIEQHFNSLKESWLLLKLTGERALIGPFFSGLAGRACWQCLQYRMKANDVLKWIQYDQGENRASPISVARLNCKETIETYLTDALPLIKRLLIEKNTDSLYELSVLSDIPRLHPVIYRPQCPSCGDDKYYEKQVSKALRLSLSVKTQYKDGGVRSLTPEKTNAKLTGLISPLSGLLTHLSMLSKDTNKTSKIYRSGFYQSPMTLDFLTYKLSNSTFMHTTMGKGISEEQSKASALSEAIERLASQFQGDEPHHLSALINDDYISPHQLSPYSESQYHDFCVQENNVEHQLYSVAKYDKNVPIHWTPVWSLSQHKTQYLPLSYCYAHTPYAEQKFSRFYHNGGAAGNTLEEALLQAFLEIVERDAVSIWWYNQLQKPAIQWNVVSPILIEQMQYTLGQEWEYWTLDLTHDLNIPVVAAIAQHKTDNTFSFGFGCHIDPIIACQRALTELCQITEIRHSNVAPFEFDKIKEKDYLFPSKATTELSDFMTPKNVDIVDDLHFCFEQATNAGLDVLALNYTRPDMVLHTAKVILPGACHIFPYFAAERLYQVPVKMGWLEKPKLESELNQQALLI